MSCGGFVIYNTVIIDIADHGQIQNTLTGMDVGNICDPPGVWSICLEIPVEQVLIFVELLSHLNPLFWSAYFGKQTIFFHDSQYCFGVPVDPLTLQPYPHPAISVGFSAIFLLILDKLTQLLLNTLKNLHITAIWKFADTREADAKNAGLREATSNVYGNGHTALYADMIEAIRHDRAPYVDAAAGRDALELVLAVYQSSFTGQPVKLPLEDVSSIQFQGMFPVSWAM